MAGSVKAPASAYWRRIAVLMTLLIVVAGSFAAFTMGDGRRYFGAGKPSHPSRVPKPDRGCGDRCDPGSPQDEKELRSRDGILVWDR